MSLSSALFTSLFPTLSIDAAVLVPPLCQFRESPGPGGFFSISQRGLEQIADSAGLHLREVMIRCLENDLWPLRFLHNRGLFNGTEQAALLRGHVAVVGCGGLGGHVCMELARLGIGQLTICDSSTFDETCLNRQIFCREDRIGQPKASAARDELALCASHMLVTAYDEAADAVTLRGILEDAPVVVDCLDSIADRRILEKVAGELGVTCIHGSLAGWEGFVGVDVPQAMEGTIMERLYGPPESPAGRLSGLPPSPGPTPAASSGPSPESLPTGLRNSFADGAELAAPTRPVERGRHESHGAELRVGAPTVTPVVVAALQVLRVINALLGREEQKDLLWHLDLSVPEIQALLLRAHHF